MPPRPEEANTPQGGRRVGHYVIGELIGKGGMGEVYRGHDERLDRDVAIKALPQQLHGSDTARKRFVRETRLACQVSHPYVATVFDVVHEETELFLIMELIEGRPLGRILRDGNPDLAVALNWGVEIVEGLTAIHRAGMVHRDLKPGNVMITPDGHVKLLDFGLARQIQTSESSGSPTYAGTITRDGTGVGTVLYMSPEQVRGNRVDERSDLFSLGTMLYEVVTGTHPFARATMVESASAILNDAPGGGSEPDSLTDSGPVRSVVLKLLEKDPARRYQSSEQLLQELREASDSGLQLEHAHPAHKPARLGILLAAAGVLIAILAGTFWWLSRPPVWEQARYSIAVAPIADRTGDEDGPLKAGLLADLLCSDLESSRLVRAIGIGRTAPLLSVRTAGLGTPEIARRVGRGTTVDYVLVASLYKEDGEYLATGEIVRPDGTPSGIPALRAGGAKTLIVAERMASALRRILPEVSPLTAWKDDRADLEQITSESEEARLHYERGLLALRDGKITEALGRFEQAIEADVGFVAAYVQLADARNRAGFGKGARDAATRAASLVDAGQAGSRMALSVDAARARVFRRKDEAVAASAQLAALFPDEPQLLMLHASALHIALKYDQALEEIGRSLELDPMNVSGHLTRARILQDASRNDEALAALDEASRVGKLVESREAMAGVSYARAMVLRQQGKLPDARRMLKQAIAASEGAGLGNLLGRMRLELASIEVYLGNPAEAEEQLREAAEVAERLGDLGTLHAAISALGESLYVRGSFDEAETSFREAIDLARRLENDFYLLYPLTNMGSLFAYTHRREEARTAMAEALEIARRLGRREAEISAGLTLADLEFQMGNLDEAHRRYDELLNGAQQDPPERMLNWALLGNAEIYERGGDLGRALESAQQAADNFTHHGVVGESGYALVWRGRIRAALGQSADARADIERAAEIAAAPAAGLGDLVARSTVARGILLGYAEDWSGAALQAEQALSAPGGLGPDVAASARLLGCRARLETGAVEQAIEHCRAIVDNETAAAADAASARALLARALARAGRYVEARDAAEAALDATERMGLRLPQMQAAAVLIALPVVQRPATLDAIRKRGRAALDAYLASVPEAYRGTVERQPELKELTTQLSES